MIHYSCDICGLKLNDQRFVARIEVYPSFDPDEITDDDLDRDNLDEIAGIIHNMDLTGDLDLTQDAPKSFRYDLCPSCQQQFVKDPLALHRPRRLRMSDN